METGDFLISADWSVDASVEVAGLWERPEWKLRLPHQKRSRRGKASKKGKS